MPQAVAIPVRAESLLLGMHMKCRVLYSFSHAGLGTQSPVDPAAEGKICGCEPPVQPSAQEPI